MIGCVLFASSLNQCLKRAKKIYLIEEKYDMYYVPDDTEKCGYYECSCCRTRFLSLQTMNEIPCPYCEADIELEIGPDEDMAKLTDSAKLIKVVCGEDVEKMDALLSLAITGGNYEWI